jgi:TP901 family phage tail tape measure protein
MAKKRINKDDVAPKDLFENVIRGAEEAEKKITSLTEVMQVLKKLAQEQRKVIKGTDPKDVKTIEQLNQATARANNLAKNKLAVGKELQKERIKLQQARAETNKLLKEEIALENKQLGTLDKLKVRNSQLRRERDKLNLSTKEGRSMLRTINAEIDRNNKIIEKNSDKLKQQKIGIGRYEKALGGLKNTLAKVGIAFGGFTLIRGAIDVAKEFETSIADLSAITGATGSDLDFLKNKALEFSTRFGQSASEITEAFKLAGSARPELLQNGEALAELTEKAIILSKASGDDVPTSINNLAGTLNAFDLDASKATEVMDTLANASQKGAKEIPFLTEAFTKFGGIAAANNVNVAESAAAIEFLGKKIPDAATAGVSLRNILLKLSAPDALPKKAIDSLGKLGVNFDVISDKSKPFNERLKELTPLLNDNAALVNTFGSQNALAAQTLIQNADALGSFTGELSEAGTAQAQMETKSKTLGEAIGKLRAGWEAFLIKLVDGTGAGNALGGVVDRLTKALKWLGENVETVITVVKIAVEAFIAFKLAMRGLQLAENIKNLKLLRKNVSDLGEGLQGAKASAKAFGAALKGIGLSIAITAVVEFAKALYDVASGAQLARFQTELFNQSVAKGTEKATAEIDKLKNKQQDLINSWRLAVSRGEMSQAEFEARVLKTNQKLAKATGEQIKQFQKRRSAFKDDIDNQRQLVADLEKQQTIIGTLTGKDIRELSAAKVRLAELGAKYREVDAAIDVLVSAQNDFKNATIDNEIAINNLNKTTAKSTKEIEKKEKAYKKIKQAALEAGEAEDKGADKIAKRLKKLNDLDDQRALDIADLEVLQADLDDDEETLLEAKIQRIEKERDIRTAMLAEGTVERLKIEKEAALQIKALQDEAADADAENQKERLKKRLEITKEWLDRTTDLFTQAYDQRIAKINEEQKAAEDNTKKFEELAKSGNITAKESLAEQNRIQAEAERERQRIEQRKQQIIAANAVLQAYLSNLEAGDDSATAFAKAFATKELIDTVISAALPAFLEGTEDTGSNGKGVDGKGGFLSILHPNERVLTKEQNAKIGNISNEELANIMEQRRLGGIVNGDQIAIGFDNHLLVQRLMSVEDKLDQVNKSIVNKPTTNIELGKIVQGSMSIIETTKKGNAVTRNRHRVKGQ